MTQQVYKELYEAMKARRGPYTGMDIPEFYELVQALFMPAEAAVNNVMTRQPATAGEIAGRMEKSETEIGAILETMADKGLCKTYLRDGVRYYEGEPFMPGIFEYQFYDGSSTPKAKEIAGLINRYKQAFKAAKGAVKMTFPLSRVITVDRTIDAGNTVHTYDQVSTYIDKYESSIAVGACYCRHAAKLRDEDVHGMPMDVCMYFGKMADYANERLGAKRMDAREARQVLDRSEEAGLIHMSRNTTEDIEFLCNCDRWHCDAVRGVLEQSKPALFFNSGYEPQFDPERCVACETCIERCPPEALALGADEVPEVNLDRCFGCAVCATGCPSDAIAMVSKPGFPVPPKDPRELIASVKASFAKQG